MTEMRSQAPSWSRSGAAAAVIVAAAAVAWLAVIHETDGMVSAPGTMGYGLAGFLVFWTVMMAAMMLPGVAPVGGLYARAIRMQAAQPGTRAARVAGLVAGYLIAWAAFGLAAFAVADVAGRLAAHDPDAARWVGAAALVAAGVYQFTRAKSRCLSHCRSPLGVLLHVGSYRGPLRDVRAGLYHGAYCIGCCWGLMVALIALGVMDLRWMAALAVVVVLERTWRHGWATVYVVGIGLIVLGLLAPWHPGLIPGLHGPEMPMPMGM
jgi:predicted metal-binding membrane protein